MGNEKLRVVVRSICCNLNLNISQGSQPESITMNTDIEPSFLCIGPCHLAVGMNNRIWFYDLENNKEEDNIKPVLKMPKILTDREYLGNVTNVCLNAEYASVLFEGRIHLHQVKHELIYLNDSKANFNQFAQIDSTSNPNNENEMQIFPDENENMRITSQWLTSEFLIYGTDVRFPHFFVNIVKHVDYHPDSFFRQVTFDTFASKIGI